MNETDKTKNKSKLFILIAVLVLVVVIIVVVALNGKGKTPTDNQSPTPSTSGEQSTEMQPGELAPANVAIDMATATPQELEGAKAIAPGTSLISSDNRVVTPTGAPVKLNVDPASVEAPRESAAIDPNSVPKDANTVNLSVSAAGFVPNSFTVKEGQLVNFALTSTDDYAHIFNFDDEALIGAILGVAGGETKMKSWNAPKKGEYTFTCSIPGHAARGETGKMIVN